MHRELGIAKHEKCLHTIGKVVTSPGEEVQLLFKKTSPKAIIFEHLLCFSEHYDFYDQLCD